jgi:hypothetical protein
MGKSHTRPRNPCKRCGGKRLYFTRSANGWTARCPCGNFVWTAGTRREAEQEWEDTNPVALDDSATADPAPDRPL